ncbi:MAG: glycosyltransferase family 4 protein [Candidatus Hydrogenedentes bacterium]|nr:glycosyltransferase family 4 protein [Candidatus Hydrogenedentota bacterium]
MMRIAIVSACPFPVPQGSQVFLRDTARALQEHGHEVHLVVYGYGDGEDEGGLRVHRATSRWPGKLSTRSGPSWSKPLHDRALVGTLRRVVHSHAIDVVQAHNYEGLLVALAARVRPIVYQAHNAMADELPHYRGFKVIGMPLGAWLDRSFPRRAAEVIAPHAGLAEYLIASGCVPGRVSVLAPPALTRWFEPSSPDTALPPVVYTGNLDAYQNILFLEHVMARVREAEPGARLLLATRDPLPFPGAEIVPAAHFDSLRALLAQDAVIVCPRVSWSGYPIKLLNAMAAGKAIVACRGAAHPLEHERSGLIVDDNDEVAFADAIVRLLRSPEERARLGDAAREAVDAHHSPRAFANTLERVFTRALVHHAVRHGRSPVRGEAPSA